MMPLAALHYADRTLRSLASLKGGTLRMTGADWCTFGLLDWGASATLRGHWRCFPAEVSMAFCAKCGADVAGAAFCPKCGAPQAAGAAAGGAPVSGSQWRYWLSGKCSRTAVLRRCGG